METPTLSVLLLSYFAFSLSVQVNGGLLKNLTQDDYKKENLTCQDYIPEQCYREMVDPSDKEPAESHNFTEIYGKNVSDEHQMIHNCQDLCNSGGYINGSFCRFFIYDKRNTNCTLWTDHLGEYEDGCVQLGGPRLPTPKTPQDCLNVTKDPHGGCEKFREGNCIFQGSLLDHLRDITDPDICQQACNHSPSCNYFVHDKDTQDCALLDSPHRTCHWMRGPVVPPYKGCYEVN